MKNEGIVKFVYKDNSALNDNNVELTMSLRDKDRIEIKELANHFYNFCCGMGFSEETIKEYVRAYDEGYEIGRK